MKFTKKFLREQKRVLQHRILELARLLDDLPGEKLLAEYMRVFPFAMTPAIDTTAGMILRLLLNDALDLTLPDANLH